MQEVEAEEDPPLKQQEEETNTVPDDSSLLHWETAAVVVHCFSWTSEQTHTHTHLLCDSFQILHDGCWYATNTCDNATQSLTIIVSFDCADQTEELDHPAETLLHLKHKHTRQDLERKHNKQEQFSKPSEEESLRFYYSDTPLETI